MTLEQRHNCMSHVRSRDTTPEKLVRHELWQKGFRYRICVNSLPGTPDIVLPRYRTVIFVNGCFWHGHKGCPNSTIPIIHKNFWARKIDGNMERDLKNIQKLETLSWNVITVWECELSKEALPSTIEHIIAELHSNIDEWEESKIKRKQSKRNTLEQAHKRSKLFGIVETELNEQFHIHVRLRRSSHDE